MAMEFEGVVHLVLEPVKGTSARGEWTKQEVIFELPGEFSKKVCVSFWGDKVQDTAGLKAGDPVSVSFNIESREYNGRWFTEVRAWKISRPVKNAQVASAPSPSPAEYPPVGNSEPYSSNEADDLPF